MKKVTMITASVSVLLTVNVLWAGPLRELSLNYEAIAQVPGNGTVQKDGNNDLVSPDEAPCCDVPEAEWTKPVSCEHLQLRVNYTIASDYVFRGVNFSEYAGEGREDLVHQLTIGMEQQIGQWWGVGAKFFFSWFAGADKLYHSGRNIQEIRYTPYVYGDIKQINSRVLIGMDFFNYPTYRKGHRHDYEWWVQVCHNDAWMWKWLWPDNNKGVLNPFIFVAQNLNEAGGGIAGLLGIKHNFSVPGVEALTLVPQFSVAADNRFVSRLLTSKRTTNMLYMNWGFSAVYDISKALKLKPAFGRITLSGSIYYSQALADYIHDELYGGMNIGWSW